MMAILPFCSNSLKRRQYWCWGTMQWPYLDDGIPHTSQVVEAFFVGTNEQHSDLVMPGRLRTLLRILLLFDIKEAYIHVQIAVFVEAGQTERDPVLTATSFDTLGFEKHVEYELEVARM